MITLKNCNNKNVVVDKLRIQRPKQQEKEQNIFDRQVMAKYLIPYETKSKKKNKNKKCFKKYGSEYE